MSSDSMRTARLLPSRFPIGSRPPRWLLAESVEHMAVIWVFLCPPPAIRGRIVAM